MPTYILYGDYPQAVQDRCDLTIIDFVQARSPEDAFRSWRQIAEKANPLLLKELEPELRVAEVGPRCEVFDVHTSGRLLTCDLSLL